MIGYFNKNNWSLWKGKQYNREFSSVRIHTKTIFYRHALKYDIATMYQISTRKNFYSFERNPKFNIDTFYKYWNND
jgi:hypothetical protein